MPNIAKGHGMSIVEVGLQNGPFSRLAGEVIHLAEVTFCELIPQLRAKFKTISGLVDLVQRI
jgi:hypothetical protein